MPAKLKVPVRFVKWRIREDDLDLLEALHGAKGVNPAVRDILHMYCEAVRRKGLPRA
jgi:hypothetical protein